MLNVVAVDSAIRAQSMSNCINIEFYDGKVSRFDHVAKSVARGAA